MACFHSQAPEKTRKLLWTKRQRRPELSRVLVPQASAPWKSKPKSFVDEFCSLANSEIIPLSSQIQFKATTSLAHLSLVYVLALVALLEIHSALEQITDLYLITPLGTGRGFCAARYSLWYEPFSSTAFVLSVRIAFHSEHSRKDPQRLLATDYVNTVELSGGRVASVDPIATSCTRRVCSSCSWMWSRKQSHHIPVLVTQTHDIDPSITLSSVSRHSFSRPRSTVQTPLRRHMQSRVEATGIKFKPSYL
ncbi:hypothetical protein K438DRAFT_1061876 [Mycena galopus ATCC 62051]|nr:hypothetical protein K438DRAFT_1061876 [Mycena galopus ATCC 62051]